MFLKTILLDHVAIILVSYNELIFGMYCFLIKPFCIRSVVGLYAESWCVRPFLLQPLGLEQQLCITYHLSWQLIGTLNFNPL